MCTVVLLAQLRLDHLARIPEQQLGSKWTRWYVHLATGGKPDLLVLPTSISFAFAIDMADMSCVSFPI